MSQPTFTLGIRIACHLPTVRALASESSFPSAGSIQRDLWSLEL